MFLLFILSFTVFIIVDLVWLIKVAPKLYRHFIGHLMAEKVNTIAALLFYALYHIGLIYFVYIPAISSSDPISALVGGALFGIMTYGTYDLTNLATLKNWPWKLTVIDLIWGAFITGATSWVMYYIATFLELI